MYIILNIISLILIHHNVFLSCFLDYTLPVSHQEWLSNNINKKKKSQKTPYLSLRSNRWPLLVSAKAEPDHPNKATPERANAHLYKRSITGSVGQQPTAQHLLCIVLLPWERAFGNRNSPLIFPNCPVITSVVPDPEGNRDR